MDLNSLPLDAQSNAGTTQPSHHTHTDETKNKNKQQQQTKQKQNKTKKGKKRGRERKGKEMEQTISHELRDDAHGPFFGDHSVQLNQVLVA